MQHKITLIEKYLGYTDEKSTQRTLTVLSTTGKTIL